MRQWRVLCLVGGWGFCALVVGCRDGGSGEGEPAVTLYCSVDEKFGQQVVEAYVRQSDVRVEVLFDQEATKTTGLVNKIKAERGQPRADVFWSSEVFNTIRLAREGLLQAYRSPAAADIPPEYKDRNGYWAGMGLRGRVIAYNTEKLKRAEVPTSWQGLADKRWNKQVAIANPIAGTTRGHVAAMFALWGRQKTTAFLEGLDQVSVRIADGNSAALRMVARSDVLLCATDTDDVWVAQKRGEPVDLVYPDMGDGGTLLIPCTVALLAGSKHPEAGRKLIDFLVSERVERMLAESDSRNIPVRRSLREAMNLPLPPASKVGYAASAEVMDEAIDVVREVLLR